MAAATTLSLPCHPLFFLLTPPPPPNATLSRPRRPLHRTRCTPARGSTQTERAQLRCRPACLPAASTQASASLHPRRRRRPPAALPRTMSALPGTAKKTKPRSRCATTISRQKRRATCLQQASFLAAATTAAATTAALVGGACPPCSNRAFGGVFDHRMPLRGSLPRPLLPRGPLLLSAVATPPAIAAAPAETTKVTRTASPTRGERSTRVPA